MANALISWQENFSLGLEAIDEQHKSLVDIINRIWQSIVEKSEKSVVFSLIEELERYTFAHFAAEETFMRVTGYPHFDRHKQEHQAFISRVSEEKRRALSTGNLSLDLMHFLRDWLVNHILLSDKHYADFTLQAKAENGSLIARLFRRFFQRNRARQVSVSFMPAAESRGRLEPGLKALRRRFAAGEGLTP